MIGLKVQGVNNFTALQWNHDVWFLAIYILSNFLSVKICFNMDDRYWQNIMY